MLTCGWVQVFEAAMDAGAEDMHRAEGEDGVLEGFKARRTPESPVGVAAHSQNPSFAKGPHAA